MILWRHMDETHSGWVYYATNSEGKVARARYMQGLDMNKEERAEYEQLCPLERVNVWHPDSKQSMTRLMNMMENGKEVKWVR